MGTKGRTVHRVWGKARDTRVGVGFGVGFFKSYFYFLRSRQSSQEGLGSGSDHGFTWIKCFLVVTSACQRPLFSSVRRHQALCAT